MNISRIVVFSYMILVWCHFVFLDGFRTDYIALGSPRSSGCNLRTDWFVGLFFTVLWGGPWVDSSGFFRAFGAVIFDDLW